MQEQKIGTILWRGKWLMAISVVVCVALAVFITKTSAKVYAASAIIQVNAPASQGTDTFQNQQASQALAKTYATLITDRSFLGRIRARIGHGDYTVSELEGLVHAQALTDTALIKLSTDGPSATRWPRANAAAFTTGTSVSLPRKSVNSVRSIKWRIASGGSTSSP